LGPSAPPPYPLENSNLDGFAHLTRDDDGVVYDPTFEGYHPLLVARYALSLYAHYYQTGDPEDLEAFWAQATWLRDSFVEVGEFGVWQYPFDYEPFAAKAPWVSALMQAFGMSVMLKAAALDPSEGDAYESTARSALKSFQAPLANGGVRSEWDDGTVWFEEYATTINSHVLNGFIFALAALYEYWQQTGDEEAEDLFRQGVDALRNKLGDFDKGYTSAYDAHYLSNTTGRGAYHTLHIEQLLWVFHVTDDPFFWEAASRWLNYDGWSRVSGPFIKNVEVSYQLDDPTFAASNLIDNLGYYGYWSSSSFPAAITLDLGEVQQDVSQIVFFAFGEANAPAAFTVELSEDGTAWTTALAATEATQAAVRGQNHTRVHHTEVYGFQLAAPADARYVRVTVNADRGAGNLALREVMLYFDQTSHARELFQALMPQFEPRQQGVRRISP
jgi:hypothetical protein